jgi:tyrosyl-tRNA synthetase
LLVGTDGVEKMGKSLGNYIAIDEPAAEQFGKLMSIPDSVVGLYARLCAAMPPREVDAIEVEVASGGSAANQAKRRMAREVVALYHGEAEALAAEERFNAIFQRGEVPTDVPEHHLAGVDDVLHLPAVLVELGFATSTSAARRDIDAGAVRLDGGQVPPKQYDWPRERLVGAVLSSGKRRVARLV